MCQLLLLFICRWASICFSSQCSLFENKESPHRPIAGLGFHLKTRLAELWRHGRHEPDTWAPLLRENVKHSSSTPGCRHQDVSWVTLIWLDGLLAHSKQNLFGWARSRASSWQPGPRVVLRGFSRHFYSNVSFNPSQNQTGGTSTHE